MKSITLLLLLAANAFASPIIFDGEKNKYQTLLDAYLQAQAPAALTDFNDAKNPKKCVVVSVSSQDNTLTTTVAVKALVITPGTPDRVIPAQPANGPLFPAKPEQKIPGTPPVTEPRLVITGDTANMTNEQINLFKNTITATDFVIEVPKNKFYYGGDIGLNGARISIRKKDGYMPFILEKAPFTDKTPLYVGYCY